MSKNQEIVIVEQLQEFPVVHSHEVIELSCPATTIEHPTDVSIGVPYEFNSLPMACYDKHIKDNQAHVYYLNVEKTRYVKIMPLHNNKINGEFEERILFGLLATAHHQKEMLHRSSISSTIITTIADLVRALGLKYHGMYKKKITESLQRLKRTGYEFKDCYYNSDEQKVTSLYEVSIISSFSYVSHLELHTLDPMIASLFSDKRVKDFLVVKIDDGLITNFINKKGYLNYNASKLLSIETGIARKIYMYCDRNRWNNKNDLIFSEKITVLAHIIPLMTKHYSKIAQIIKNALKELLNNKLIIDYKFYEESPIKNSWIEVYFLESRKFSGTPVQVQHVHVHSKEIIDVMPKKEEAIHDLNIKLHQDITELFKDIGLQTSTIKLVNDLYEKNGILHIKALIKDVLDHADNYDSYIFTMLSKDSKTKWYETNQSKYLSELSTKEKEEVISKQTKTQAKLLKDEYNNFILDEHDLSDFKQSMQIKISEKIEVLRNNPPKLLSVLESFDLSKYLADMELRYKSYLNQDNLYHTWLIFYNKSLDHITNPKDLDKIKHISSDLFK
ncbi:MAG: hypothetical protein K2P99_04280 [Burkholderiales bacterium]|nr:hypothetical protein [Burkholderiales bacterium]